MGCTVAPIFFLSGLGGPIALKVSLKSLYQGCDGSSGYHEVTWWQNMVSGKPGIMRSWNCKEFPVEFSLQHQRKGASFIFRIQLLLSLLLLLLLLLLFFEPDLATNILSKFHQQCFQVKHWLPEDVDSRTILVVAFAR